MCDLPWKNQGALVNAELPRLGAQRTRGDGKAESSHLHPAREKPPPNCAATIGVFKPDGITGYGGPITRRGEWEQRGPLGGCRFT